MVLIGKMRFALALVLFSFVLTAQAEVRLPHGEYYLNTQDLKVKVLGGHVTVRRSWYRGEWFFNRAWSKLVLQYSTLDSGLRVIQRNEDRYEQDNPQSTVYRFGKSRTIRQTPSGFRWQNRSGDWINYDAQGIIQSYGDRNNIQVSFVYADGRLSQVLNHQGNPVLTYHYNAQGELDNIQDNAGHQVSYTYTNGQLSQFTDVRGFNSTYGYNNNLLTSMTDPEGHTQTITYDPAERVASITNALGHITEYRYQYDRNRREYYNRITDPTGVVKETWHDSDGRIIRRDTNGIMTYRLIKDNRKGIATDRRGNKTNYDYDEWDRISGMEYPDGSTTKSQYHPSHGGLLKSIDENGVQTRNEYDVNGNKLRMIEAEGTPVERITTYTYNGLKQRVTETVEADANSVATTTTYAYDADGNVSQVTDAEGQITQYEYNSRGEVTKITDANNHITIINRDNAGSILNTVNALNQTTTYTYDKNGNRKTVKDARNNTQTSIYDAENRLTSQSDNKNNLTKQVYDNAGRLKTIIDPLNNQTQLKYDNEGRLSEQTDAAGNVTKRNYGDQFNPGTTGGGVNGDTIYADLLNRVQYPTYLETYDYDLRDRQTQTHKRLDENTVQTTKTTYDRVGNRIQSTDALGRITQYQYDALNRLTQIIDPNNQTTALSYDNRDNLLSVTDPNGHTTQYQYDNVNRKTNEIFPEGQAISYAYDLVGNLTQTTDPDGRITINIYDDANRQTEQKHFAPGQGTPERTVTYTYDDNGNLTGWNDGEHSETYVHDENNQKTQTITTYNISSASPIVLTNNLTYDAGQNKKTQTGPDSVTIEYRWDKDRLQQVIIPGEGNIAYVNYQWNRPSTIRYPGGAERTLTYDALMRLMDIQTKDQQQQDLFGLNYKYDLTNNITQKANAQTKTDYDYDVLQRLTEAKKSTVTPDPQNSTLLNTEGWQYDPNGNRTQDNEQPGTWTYDDNDRLQQTPKKSYEYDNAGNPTKITDTTDNSIQQHNYNAEGRLSKITNITDINNPTVVAEYQYDPLGRRIKKITTTETRYFHYNDEGLIGEYQDNGTVIQAYGYAPDSIWTTDPLYTKTEGFYAYYYNDHLGTPQQLRDADNNLLWAGDAKAFGETAETLKLISNPLRFPGQYEDQETGLYSNYFRDYDPTVGRYIERDPIGLRSGANVYAYVKANPLKYVDFLGLVTWTGTMKSSSAAYIFGGAVYRFNLESKCVDGVKAKVKVTAVGPAIGIGGEAGLELTEVELTDPYDKITPSTFNGWFGLGSAGFSFFVVGYGAYSMHVGGDHRGKGGAVGWGHGPSIGLSLGAITVQGSSILTSTKYKDCCAED